MVRVHVLCEGQTEEAFTTKVLAPSLAERGVYLLPRLFGGQGGDVRWPRIKRDILRCLKGEQGAYCTTFIDYYGRGSAFPGEDDARRAVSAAARKQSIEAGMLAEVEHALGDGRRFIPYVQMYEFEGLLFSDPERVADVVEMLAEPDVVASFAAKLRSIRNDFESPEHINDGRDTAPSKRLDKGFSKVLHGILSAEAITLPVIRGQCSFFHAWVERLEGLAPAYAGAIA